MEYSNIWIRKLDFDEKLQKRMEAFEIYSLLIPQGVNWREKNTNEEAV